MSTEKNPSLTKIVATCSAVTVLWFTGLFWFVQTKYIPGGGHVDTLYTHTNTIKVYDSTQHRIYIPVETPERIIQLPPEQIPALVDTQAILSAWFNQAIYSRVFADSNIRATIDDTVSHNRLGRGKFTYQWLKPVSYITTTTTVLQQAPDGGAQFFGGINLCTQPGAPLQFGPRLDIQTKKTLYSIGTSLTTPRPNFQFGLSKRIFKLKHKNKPIKK